MTTWLRPLVFWVALAGTALAPVSESDALEAYLQLTGERQGQIKGGVTKPGHEGAIKVTSVNHQVSTPVAPATGLPTGKRQHKPFVITKPIDKSSPMLHNALARHEHLSTFELGVYEPGAKGKDVLTYRIRLTNASVTSIHTGMDKEGNLRQEVAFTYQKIEWVWMAGGITAEDDWGSASAKSK